MRRGIETRGTGIRGIGDQEGLFQKTSSEGARKGAWEGGKSGKVKKKRGIQLGNKKGTMHKVGLTQNGRCLSWILISRLYQFFQAALGMNLGPGTW